MSSLDKSLESKFNDLKLAINEDRGRLPTSQGVNALIMVYPCLLYTSPSPRDS